MTAILQQDIIDHLAIGDAGNSHEKGKALEDVVENTMCLIDGVGLIDRNVEDMPGSLEIDLILYNHQVTGTGLPFFPALLIIECKNWAVPVNAATLRAFTSKLGFVRFPSGPGPEHATVCDVVEGVIEGQDASAHVVNIFPSSPM